MGTQKAQHPLINARTLNLTRDHGIVYGVFPDHGMLGFVCK